MNGESSQQVPIRLRRICFLLTDRGHPLVLDSSLKNGVRSLYVRLEAAAPLIPVAKDTEYESVMQSRDLKDGSQNKITETCASSLQRFDQAVESSKPSSAVLRWSWPDRG
jgi:hypothetical protein